MASVMEILQRCRLCLVKDQVNIPIFEEQGDIRQIFLKISACLPVKVSREDNLPKKICDGCSYKLELLYQFWNTSASSEKQLLKWLNQVGIEKLPTSDKPAAVKAQSHSINSDNVVLKQEVVDLGDNHADDIDADDLNVSNDATDYLLQQQQLPYQPVTFEFQQEGFTEAEATSSTAGPSATVTSEAAGVAPKRKRRAAAMKALPPHIDSEEEDDVDLVETKIAKTEEQSDDSAGEDPEPTTFVGLPSTSTDNEQPGPSGVGKGAAEAPSVKRSTSKTKLERKSLPRALTQCSKLQKFKIKQCEIRLIRYDPLLIPKQEVKEEPSSPVITLSDTRNTTAEVFIDVCSAKTMKSTEVDVYNIVKGARAKYKCKGCSKSFSSHFDLTNHKKLHHMKQESDNSDDGDLHSDNGDEDFVPDENSNLSDEDKIVNKHGVLQDSYRCDICDDVCGNKMDFENHLLFHHQISEGKTAAIMSTSKMTSTNKTNDMEVGKWAWKHVPKIPKGECTCSSEDSNSKCDFCENGPKYVCTNCQKEFGAYELLAEHFNADHKWSIYICQECGRGYTKKIYVIRHLNQHKGLISCYICASSFDNESNLAEHILRHKVKCKQCDTVCTSKVTLSTHVLENHKGVKYTCEICNKTFNKYYLFKVHKDRHRVGEFKCEKCGKVSERYMTHLRHLQKHRDRKQVLCDECGKEFPSKINLKSHIKTVHLKKKYVCKVCKKEFAGAKNRNDCQDKHAGIAKYKCETCKKAFYYPNSLLIHTRIHTGEKPYLCMVCGRRFYSSQMLLKHCLSHGISEENIREKLKSAYQPEK